MIALLQRVSEASVLVNEKPSIKPGEGEISGEIGPGILALVAIERGDGEAQADRLLQRILAYRMFEDENGRMNLSLRQNRRTIIAGLSIHACCQHQLWQSPELYTGGGTRRWENAYLIICLIQPVGNLVKSQADGLVLT